MSFIFYNTGFYNLDITHVSHFVPLGQYIGRIGIIPSQPVTSGTLYIAYLTR